MDNRPDHIVSGLSGVSYNVGDIWSQKDVPNVPGVSDLAVRLVLSRKVNPDDLGRFFVPRIADWMVDPSSLCEMDRGARIICQAILAEQKIGLVGDYDVDGATSIAIIGSYLTDIGHAGWEFHVPQRLTDGYGVTPKAIDHLRKRGCSTILVLDSGTIAFDAIEYARLMGVNLVIIDHHNPNAGWKAPGEDGFTSVVLTLDPDNVSIPAVTQVDNLENGKVSIPPDQCASLSSELACIINPKRADDHSGLDHLCTAGLTVLLCVKLNSLLREAGVDPSLLPNVMDYMGFAALGTVADIMSLTGLNRAYVSAGLSRMHIMPGIAGLVMAANGVSSPDEFPSVRSQDLGFRIGPAVNAAGRIDDCELGANTLLCRDLESAVSAGQNLVDLNVQRRQMQDKIEQEAMEMAKAQAASGQRCLVVSNETWHPGVIGIIAGRLREQFNLPAVVIGQDGKGSGRSAHGFNLGGAFQEATAAGILVKGGGHEAAGGLTVEWENVDAFTRFLVNATRDLKDVPSRIDAVLPASRIGSGLVLDIEAMEPFGMGNPTPIWLIENVTITGAKWVGDNKNHLRVFIQPAGNRMRFSAIMFSAKDTPLAAVAEMVGKTVDLVVDISRDRRSAGGIPAVDIKIKDVVLPS